MTSCVEKDVENQANALELLAEQWIPYCVDDYEDECLQSFRNIKAKTLRDLYHLNGNDKSPKGFVDLQIRPLVNLLNLHPCFATLSSCSGRIVLFDPQLKYAQDLLANSSDNEEAGVVEDEDDDSPSRTEESSKGHGGWLLASHTQVDPSLLETLLDDEACSENDSIKSLEEQPLVFKHEPLLLHVAASSLSRGRQLLSLVLQLGFRESGLVVTEHRVTVAIRSHSLALCVPLSRHQCHGALRPPSTYLQALVQQANQRMLSNHDRLQRLQREVEQILFRPQKRVLSARVRSIPPINLWGHATVTVPLKGSSGDAEIVVFGGYGEGPRIENGETETRNACDRSRSVYCLEHKSGVFKSQWRRKLVDPVVGNLNMSPQRLAIKQLGIWFEVVPADFAARQGLGAFLWPLDVGSNLDEPLIVLWGGRASPSKPFVDLLIHNPLAVRSIFLKPCDARGEPPEPRWGHALTALSGKDGMLAVLSGGRNEHLSFGSVHLLSVHEGRDSGAGHFQWDRLETDVSPRFHHTSVVVDDDTIVIFGGLSDPSNLLEGFCYPKCKLATKEKCPITAIRVNGNNRGSMLRISATSNLEGNRFVGSSCAITISDVSGSANILIALSGGIPTDSTIGMEQSPIYWCQVEIDNDSISLISRDDIELRLNDGNETIDIGALVQHCCVPLPCTQANCADIIFVGGGIPLFAFGPSFASA